MRFAMFLTMKRVVIGGLCAVALAAGACADGRGAPTSPGAGPSVSPLAASSPRSGDLNVTKECSQIRGPCGPVLHDHVLERRGH